MAGNLFKLSGHYFTKEQADTTSEHLSRFSITGNNRFRTLLNAKKMNDTGTPAWTGLYTTLNKFSYYLRFNLMKKLGKK